MASNRLKIFVDRYKTRQGVPRIGAEYQPAIQAVKGEAPSLGRCARLYFPRYGRVIHTLSAPETAAAFVAAAHPRNRDILEQRCLPPLPDINPLALYPEMRGRRIEGLPGTLAIAEQCGLLAFHPSFLSDDRCSRIPVPLTGDLLLILRDEDGLYAVNWTIKLNNSGFLERQNRRPVRRKSLASQQKAEARLRIESECYAQAGIPTHRVTGVTFDEVLVANLRMCAAWLSRPTKLNLASQNAMISCYCKIIDTNYSPLDLLEKLMLRFDCSRQDCLIVFYQAVWHRQLQINLFRSVMFDTPLQSAKEEWHVKYAQYFSRSGK
ncbi:hypothetical protein [Vogesella oryzae]|uniref:hypothetical protein n=1 Tax=Vogesella oryzae TaxID=1735285 RepID=UPI00158284FE|nr:hypothetical protein [Vogesella oryzae]